MKQLILLALFISCCILKLTAQTTQEFLKACYEDERKNGAKTIIISANLCSACMTEPIFEGRLFIIDSMGTYKVRHLKYVNGYASVNVLEDSTYPDLNIREIFKIAGVYRDSIFEQLSNMDHLLSVPVLKNGKTVYREPIMHGKMRYVGLFHNDRAEIAISSVVSLNSTFDKAYYYWILNSSINNYCSDHTRNSAQ